MSVVSTRPLLLIAVRCAGSISSPEVLSDAILEAICDGRENGSLGFDTSEARSTRVIAAVVPSVTHLFR